MMCFALGFDERIILRTGPGKDQFIEHGKQFIEVPTQLCILENKTQVPDMATLPKQK